MSSLQPSSTPSAPIPSSKIEAMVTLKPRSLLPCEQLEQRGLASTIMAHAEAPSALRQLEIDVLQHRGSPRQRRIAQMAHADGHAP